MQREILFFLLYYFFIILLSYVIDDFDDIDWPIVVYAFLYKSELINSSNV